MKKLILSIITIFAFITVTSADLGSCAVYYAKFYLKDGSSFRGCFEVMGYDVQLDKNGLDKHCSDEGIFLLFKDMQKRKYNEWIADGGIQDENTFHKIPVYKSIAFLNPKSITKHKYDGWFNYGFVDTANVVLLDSSDIEKTIFWEAKYSDRAWLTSEMVMAPKDMIETIQNDQYWNSIVVNMDYSDQDSLAFSEHEDVMSGYRLINYNSKNNREELKRLARLKLHLNLNEDFNKKYNLKSVRAKNEALQKYMQSLRLWFWERGIVMIQVNGTC